MRTRMRARVSEWPTIRVNVNPSVLERMEREAEARALSVAAVVREALDRSYGSRSLTELQEAR
jgi:hypothetical protein